MIKCLKGLYFPWLDDKSSIHHKIVIKMYNFQKKLITETTVDFF